MRDAKKAAQKRMDDNEQQQIAIQIEAKAQLKRGELLALYRELVADSEDIDDDMARFLAYYAYYGTVTRALVESRTSRHRYYKWQQIDSFRLAFREAERMHTDSLEQTAIDLASGVFKRPIASGGKLVAYEDIYDSKVLLALIKSRLPEKYAQRVDITSNGNTLVKLVDKELWDAV